VFPILKKSNRVQQIYTVTTWPDLIY